MALGDAAGYIEPFTGEGMAWALAQGRAVAPLAARAARQWSPDYGRAWCTEYEEMMRQRQRWCRRVATTLRHPILTGWLAEAAALFPRLAEPLLRCFTMPVKPEETPEMREVEQVRPAHP
jgi:flavin-dependent dehydrogenase